MPRPPQTDAQKAATQRMIAARQAKYDQERAAKEAAQTVSETIIDVTPIDTPAAQELGGPGRAAIGTPQDVFVPEETITVPVSALDALIEQKVQAMLAAKLAGTPQGTLPATPIAPAKPVWAFLHADSPGFATLLPRDLQSHTGDGYVRFRPDGAPKNRLRPKRGKFVTDDPQIAAWLNERIESGNLANVLPETDRNRLTMMEREAAEIAA